MSIDKALFGEIFISHSSVDKPARRLAQRIEKAGFRTWLDEKQLLPGDPLAQRLSEALAHAKAVIVVVSPASLKSKWLAFELNKATDRMVKGECRVIPAVREKGNLPPEVGGLLYADFTRNFDLGLKSVLTALEHDAHQRALKHSFWARTEVMLKDVFGGTGFVSGGGEYKRIDYSIVCLKEETWVAYEIVSGHSESARPLSDFWWDEYSNEIESFDENLFIVVSERPVAFAVEHPPGAGTRIGVRTRGWMSHAGYQRSGYVVTVDFSGLNGYTRQKRLLEQAKAQLLKLADDLARNERDGKWLLE